MIYFEKIRWRNFLSTGNAFTEVVLNDAKMKLFVGRNGHGKSTLIDALCYVLFKSPFRDINLPQLVNSKNGKQLEVEIWFRIGRKNYRIRRGMKPAVFEIYENEKLVDQDAATKDYQAYLEKDILKMTFETFKQVVVLGSRDYTPFMQLKAADRRAVIENLLDLQVFTSMNAVLKMKIDQNKSDLEACAMEIRWATENIALEKKRKSILTESNADRITDLQNKLTQIKQTLEETNADHEKLLGEISTLQETITDEDQVRSKIRKYDDFEYKLLARMERIDSDSVFFESHDNCPTCRQSIDEQFKCETVTANNAKRQEIEDGLDKLRSERATFVTRLDEIDGTKQRIRLIEKSIYGVEATIWGCENSIKEITNEINDLQSKNQEIETDSSELEKWEVLLAEETAKREALLAQQEIRKAAALILKDGGIKAQIIKKYVPQMNQLINKYLAALDFYVKFELDETFKETIKSRYRDEFSYGNFSVGQKLRIDLSILFAWRAIAKKRNSASTNLLIMDEVFDGPFDIEGLDDVFKMIAVASKDSNVIVISPKGDQMHDKFETIYKYELVRDYSKMTKVK